MKTRTILILLGLAALGGVAYETGIVNAMMEKREAAAAKRAAPPEIPVPVVSVVRAEVSDFVASVLVTGSLVARDEIMVAPEIDGLRVMELKADEGDRVKKGDVLAVLVFEQLDAQIAQNEAALARSNATIAQTTSQIVEAEARLAEAKSSLERARPLVQNKYLSESVFDQRDAAAKMAAAQVVTARGVLKSAEAEKAQVEAQRRELDWRRSNTEVRAPADGIISRRNVRIGSIANGGSLGGGEPLFRMVARGEIELDAELSETRMAHVTVGQKAKVQVAGAGEVEGTVRLISPEVDKATRLGKVRVFLGSRSDLRVGAFARGIIETGRAHNIAVPQSAILYDEEGHASVQIVEAGIIVKRRIETGLAAGNQVEIKSGVAEGDLVVAKAGTFLREGDAVRASEPTPKVSEASQ
jgi:RND family efflux transporter MFP subunit